MSTNPYIYMRRICNVTQNFIARRADISEQYIRRLEHGTVSNTNGAVNTAYYTYAVAQDKIDKFLLGIRIRLATEEFVDPASDPKNPTFLKLPDAYDSSLVSRENLPKEPDYPYQKFVETWFKAWRTQERKKLSSEDIEYPRSVYSLCRTMIIHPFLVQKYEAVSEVESVPYDIQLFLNETGIPLHHFEAALSRARMYKDRHAS